MTGTATNGMYGMPSQLWSLVGIPSPDSQETNSLDTRSRCDLTMDAIKAYIIKNRLKPGDLLPTETTLCKELNASRSSVREANRKLEALHIVDVVHGKGTFVGNLSLDPLVETLGFRAIMMGDQDLSDLRDVINVRRILDLGMAEDVVKNLQNTEQPHLIELTEEMSASAKKGSTFLAEDISFHTELLKSANNTILTQLARSLWLVHMAVLPQLGLQVSAALNTTADAHYDMVNAAIKGDVKAYRQAVVAHYEPIEEILRSKLQ